MQSCKDDHNHEDTDYGYSVDIVSPPIDTNEGVNLAADKKVGQTLAVKVDFTSATGEKVHNIAVRIYKVGEETTLAHDFHNHVHVDATYSYEEKIELTDANSIGAHSDWVLEAKVWGHEEGLQEMVKTIGFQVHPE